VKQVCEEFHELKAFVERLGLEGFEYRGENMAALSMRVLLELLRQQRRVPKVAERKGILEQQNNCCDSCGRPS
jgi:hypothetical protein